MLEPDALARIPLLQDLPGASRLATWLEPVRVAASEENAVITVVDEGIGMAPQAAFE